MKYAVIRIAGRQYRVSEGKEVLVDRLPLKPESKFDFPEVLLIRTDSSLLIGEPLVKEGKVTGKVLGEVKGEKIKISKFKAKVRYHRTIGFRPIYTKVLIEQITTSKRGGIDKREKKG
jgi:large subunit ribosomal protein L21